MPNASKTIVLFVSVLLVNTLIQCVPVSSGFDVPPVIDSLNRDGKSNYMEGLMLVSLYFVISLACKMIYLSFVD